MFVVEVVGVEPTLPGHLKIKIYYSFCPCVSAQCFPDQENHAYVSFTSARCKKRANCKQQASTIQFYPKLAKGSINFNLSYGPNLWLRLPQLILPLLRQKSSCEQLAYQLVFEHCLNDCHLLASPQFTVISLAESLNLLWQVKTRHPHKNKVLILFILYLGHQFRRLSQFRDQEQLLTG